MVTVYPRWRVKTVTIKVAALFLAGGVAITTAQAQTEGTRINMLPLPKQLPLAFFAPDSLAGAMLEPLALPEAPAGTQLAAGNRTGSIKAVEPQAEPRPERTAQADPDETSAGEAPADDTPAAAAADETPSEAAPEPAAAEAQPDAEGLPATVVHVIVENVESDSGFVNIAVCDTGLSEEGCPYHISLPASRGFVEAMFDNVPPGIYAVVGYHDVNENQEFDKFLGVPREPYALSGAAAEKLVPSFADAALKIKEGENYVIIRMKRLGNG